MPQTRSDRSKMFIHPRRIVENKHFSESVNEFKELGITSPNRKHSGKSTSDKRKMSEDKHSGYGADMRRRRRAARPDRKQADEKSEAPGGA